MQLITPQLNRKAENISVKTKSTLRKFTGHILSYCFTHVLELHFWNTNSIDIHSLSLMLINFKCSKLPYYGGLIYFMLKVMENSKLPKARGWARLLPHFTIAPRWKHSWKTTLHRLNWLLLLLRCIITIRSSFTAGCRVSSRNKRDAICRSWREAECSHLIFHFSIHPILVARYSLVIDVLLVSYAIAEKFS